MQGVPSRESLTTGRAHPLTDGQATHYIVIHFMLLQKRMDGIKHNGNASVLCSGVTVLCESVGFRIKRVKVKRVGLLDGALLEG